MPVRARKQCIAESGLHVNNLSTKCRSTDVQVVPHPIKFWFVTFHQKLVSDNLFITVLFTTFRVSLLHLVEEVGEFYFFDRTNWWNMMALKKRLKPLRNWRILVQLHKFLANFFKCSQIKLRFTPDTNMYCSTVGLNCKARVDISSMQSRVWQTEPFHSYKRSFPPHAQGQDVDLCCETNDGVNRDSFQQNNFWFSKKIWNTPWQSALSQIYTVLSKFFALCVELE